MPNLNQVFLMGNLTREVELRYTPQGLAVTNLGLAISHNFKNNAQEIKSEVCFVTVVVWGKDAENCTRFLRKGSLVFVEGRLTFRSWIDKEQKKHNVVEVRAETIQFLDKTRTIESGDTSEEIEE